MNKVIKAHVFIFLANLIYAGNFTVAKLVMPKYIQPFGFILLRASTGMLVFMLLHYFFIKEKVARKDLGLLALCGLFGVAINQLMFFKGLNWTTPINGALIMTTTPILVLGASAIILKERITSQKIIGMIVGLVGAVLLIAYGQDINFSSNQLWGNIFILINACSYGIYLVLVKPLFKKYHPITIVKWVFIFGWIVIVPFGLGDLPAIEWGTFTSGIWLALAYVLICVTVLAYLFNATGLKEVNASVVSAYIYSQPLLASSIALLAGQDDLSLNKVLAGMLIMLGVFLVSYQRQKTKPVS